nr:hypothetical protein [Tanacetum cinerariifolium]
MREEGCASWDRDTSHGKVGRGVGYCSCMMGVHKNGWRKGAILGGKICKVPLANFENLALLVPGLLSLTFDGFGFDLLAEIVPRLRSLINRASL